MLSVQQLGITIQILQFHISTDAVIKASQQFQYIYKKKKINLADGVNIDSQRLQFINKIKISLAGAVFTAC